MRFVNADGRAALLVEDQVFDLATASGDKIPSDPMRVVTDHWQDAHEIFLAGVDSGGVPVSEVRLGPPVPAPTAIFAIGMNYRSHAAEIHAPVSAIPAVFTKFPSSVTGPYDDIVLPAGEGTTDFEAELAFVVGDGGHGLGPDDALGALRGFTIAQDISERFVQMAAGGQFSLGKSFDTFCPLGPAIVTLDELGDPSALTIECRVNGEVMQRESTRDMIVDVRHLVELLASVVTLRPGDVCVTGTPGGVGFTRVPPRYLRPGDVIETEISGLGLMRNCCVPAGGQSPATK